MPLALNCRGSYCSCRYGMHLSMYTCIPHGSCSIAQTNISCNWQPGTMSNLEAAKVSVSSHFLTLHFKMWHCSTRSLCEPAIASASKCYSDINAGAEAASIIASNRRGGKSISLSVDIAGVGRSKPKVFDRARREEAAVLLYGIQLLSGYTFAIVCGPILDWSFFREVPQILVGDFGPAVRSDHRSWLILSSKIAKRI